MSRLGSLIVVATGAIAVCVVLFQRFDEHSAASQSMHLEHEDSGYADTSMDLETHQHADRSTTANSRDLPSSIDIPSGVNSEYEAYLVWLRSRGYFGSDDLALYAAYEKSTLEDLSSQGDLLASYALYDKHLQAHDLKAAHEAAYEGVVHGSTRNIGAIANSYVGQAISPRADQPDTSRANWIAALAWYEVAGIRGDSEMNELGWDIAAREGVELTVRERADVSALALDLYDKLEQERAERGMLPYDNTPVDPSIAYPDL